ncbi:MAG: gamma carbonic anhydrase family protein [Proteobacteria bacterium]|nr:gamma carbonic anhydrase family protein [Pseudomonadota bacterium]
MEFKELVAGKDVRFGQNVVITGHVNIGNMTSVWHNCILRGDVEPITIGERCNIQDNTVLHGQLGQFAVKIGNGVSVGHSCIIHGCELADDSFVGMGSIVMNGAFIGSQVLVAAGSLVPQGARFDKPNTLVMGRPGKVVRELRESEINMIKNTPAKYIQYAQQWLPPMEN